jgi:hypothetical protein
VQPDGPDQPGVDPSEVHAPAAGPPAEADAANADADAADADVSADLAPLDVDGVGAVTAGTLAWTVALVLCVVFRSPLEAAGNGWWVWVCLAGALLGLPGLWYVRRRRDAYRRAAAAAATGTADPA